MLYFEKFHGTGNDFIIFDGINTHHQNPSDLARKVCHRHYGIGADGMMIVSESDTCDVKMIFYNADGSIAPMCGNGIRCFVKYVYDHQIVNKPLFNVETLAGVMKVEITAFNDGVERVRINMGKPSFDLKQMPVNIEQDRFINEQIEIDDKQVNLSVLTMGTLHSVVFVDSVTNVEIDHIGPLIERHPWFPKRINVNFVEVVNKTTIKVTTYERGVGQTYSCGTGSSASAVMSSLLKGTNSQIDVIVPGGTLMIEQIEDEVYMSGPAEFICKGHFNYKEGD